MAPRLVLPSAPATLLRAARYGGQALLRAARYGGQARERVTEGKPRMAISGKRVTANG
jgi:hypothetical protein